MPGSTLGLLRQATLALGLAALLGVEVVVGAYLGRYLDGILGTRPWLALLGAFGGLVGGTMVMLAALRKLEGGQP